MSDEFEIPQSVSADATEQMPDPADVLIDSQRATVTAALAGLDDGTVVLVYDSSLNPSNAILPGVPLRNLTAGDIRAMPEWLQRSVFNAPGFLHAAG